MTDSSKKPEIGVLKFLPATISFLAEPAIRFGGEPLKEIADETRLELYQIAKRVREGNHFKSVEEFLETHPMTEHEECSKLLNLFGLLDRLDLIYKNYLLSFVTNDSGQMVSIHMDLNGANELLETVEYIRDQLAANDCPHSHLFAHDELTSTMLQNQEQETNSVAHVKIYGWNDEWALKHGLRPF